MNDTTPKYFDLTINGIGYVNRVREVKPADGETFLAVDIAALHGRADAVQYTRFDCRVAGKEATVAANTAIPYVAAGRRVLAGFVLSGLNAQPFTYRSGERAGDTGVSLRCRLIRIAWLKVDGESVYTAPRSEERAA